MCPTPPAFIVRVAVPSPLRRLFDYLPLPDSPLPRPGCRVRVPFGRQQVVALVISLESDTEIDRDRLKCLGAIIDETPLLDEALLQLYLWAARYYLYPPGRALQTSLPAPIREGKALDSGARKGWALSPAAGDSDSEQRLQRAPQQAAVFSLLQRYGSMSGPELGAALGKNAAAALRALQDKGLVEQVPLAGSTAPGGDTEAPLTLNAQQAQALQQLRAATGGYSCTLLEGITGSGKTEVYLQLIADVLDAGRQVLVLVPEISLTPQTIARFARRFDVAIAVFHSGLTNRQRFEGWVQASRGEARILIGTRSAVFTPMPRAGLIIIDEEHDDSYKQQDGFRYSARDVAVYRARQLDIPVVLGSATPSLETLGNALQGRYRHLQLTARAGAAAMPDIQLVDMKLQASEDGFSPLLLEAIGRHLADNRQVLVFLNRRGFAPLMQCQSCGWIAECPRCERSYTLHQQPAALRCHHCNASKPLPRRCPVCDSGVLGAIGQGTERSEGFLSQQFPDYPVIRIDRDSTRASGSLQAKIDDINSGLPCILVGTQMLAKGHHFPRVTLVAILDADSGLFSADFRGQENLGQLLTQVAGRAGRSDSPGQVLVQSFHVTHPGLLQLTNDGYGPFARDLLEQRRRGGLPPFTYFILVRAEANQRQLPETFLLRARALFNETGHRGVELHGPMPSPVGKKAGLFRQQLILQADHRGRLQQAGQALVEQLDREPAARKVRWQVDVDPVDFS